MCPSELIVYGIFVFYEFFSNCVFVCNAEVTCVAEVDDGLAIGLNDIGVNGNRMCSYLGIPYAEAPVEEMRFEPPVPYKWKGIKNFVEESDKCAQMENLEKGAPFVVGDEDCLYLNVYTPLRVNYTKLLPVFFWIHGGSFLVGSASSDLNGFDHIIEKDIIVVSINYRLGPLGFLSIPSLNITGNLGLKDQLMALQWVQRNIKGFGGNPKKVTIVGWSAGGASVTYHMYSKQSRGLFHRAIAMSGTMLNPWAYLESTSWCGRNFLEFTQFNTKEELKNASFADLMPQLNGNLMFSYFSQYHFCFIPTIEPTYVPNRFLKKSPIRLARTPINNVSLMIGYTSMESETMYPSVEYYMSNFNFANMNDTVNEAVQNYIQNFTEVHFDTEDDQKLFLRKLGSMADSFYGIQNFIDTYSKKSKARTYAYKFSFDGKFGNFKQTVNKKWLHTAGSVHGDELGYLFVPFYKSNDTESVKNEIRVSQQVVELWTNFVKYGNPTPSINDLITIKWKPYNEKSEILNINDTMKMEKIENSIRFDLWDKIYKCLNKYKCSFLGNGQMNLSI